MLSSGKRTARRVALVIGNSAYPTAPLKNPKNDASSISRILRELAFDVQERSDLDHTGMDATFQEFESKHSDVALLYYSGHGLQVDGVNYLVPVDAEAAAFPGGFVAVEQWIDRMSRCSSARLIFFDACRDNPFARDLIETTGRGMGDSKDARSAPIVVRSGLAEVKAKAGTFIAFAAAPGMVAYDGKGKHSPFTEGLLRNIETTDLPISNLMIRVRNDVLASTNGRQQTWDHSALMAPFFFNPGSLILLIGNAIGLIAFIVSLLPHQFALAAARLWQWWTTVPIAVCIWLLTLVLFLIGLQRAYGILRGEREFKGAAAQRAQPRLEVSWRKGVFGGYFGGIIAGPIIASAYYLSWTLVGLDPEKDYPDRNVGPRPPFGEMLTEFTVAAVFAGVLLGFLSLVVAEYFAHNGRRFPARSPARNRLIGAMLGGLLAAVIVMPPLVLHFEPKRWIVPHAAAMFPGGLLGTAIAVFSIANYSLEQFSVRKLIRTGLSVLRSMFIVSSIAIVPLLALLIIPHYDFALKSLENLGVVTLKTGISIPHGWPIMVVGLSGGIVFGPLLGALIGLTFMRSAPD